LDESEESVEHDDGVAVVVVVVIGGCGGVMFKSDFDFRLRCRTKFVADDWGSINFGLGRVGGGFDGGFGCCRIVMFSFKGFFWCKLLVDIEVWSRLTIKLL
jgi:hypothetical protein